MKTLLVLMNFGNVAGILVLTLGFIWAWYAIIPLAALTYIVFVISLQTIDATFGDQDGRKWSGPCSLES